MRLLLASSNPKKRVELQALLAPLEIELVSPSSIGGLPEVVEDRDTFRDNAAKKATEAALASGLWSLADDSGLEVEALGGEPGVRSARYAGEPADDGRNNEKLLIELGDRPAEERGARFVCALALARPDGTPVLEVQGTVAGEILFAPRGENDFGYDPLFCFTEESDEVIPGRSFAEMSAQEKGRVSHRGRALRALTARLPEILRQERASQA